jgi:hypothetical protein
MNIVGNEQQTTDEAQRKRVAAMTFAERLRLLDQICRDLTRIAERAQRVN